MQLYQHEEPNPSRKLSYYKTGRQTLDRCMPYCLKYVAYTQFTLESPFNIDYTEQPNLAFSQAYPGSFRE